MRSFGWFIYSSRGNRYFLFITQKSQTLLKSHVPRDIWEEPWRVLETGHDQKWNWGCILGDSGSGYRGRGIEGQASTCPCETW